MKNLKILSFRSILGLVLSALILALSVIIYSRDTQDSETAFQDGFLIVMGVSAFWIVWSIFCLENFLSNPKKSVYVLIIPFLTTIALLVTRIIVPKQTRIWNIADFGFYFMMGGLAVIFVISNIILESRKNRKLQDQ